MRKTSMDTGQERVPMDYRFRRVLPEKAGLPPPEGAADVRSFFREDPTEPIVH
jgi:hypothetical protein